MTLYINKFLNLKCASDIISITQPLKVWDKEISEAYSIYESIKDLLEENPKEKFIHVDLCSGNALTPIMSAFLLKQIKYSYAIDKNKRIRDFYKIKSFTYHNVNIHNLESLDSLKKIRNKNIIITAIHPCKNLAKQVIEIYNNTTGPKYLFLMPCCVGKFEYDKKHQIDIAWSKYLLDNIKVPIVQKFMWRDEKILSPKNIVIEAWEK